MNTDDFFRIGYSHSVCQDYTISDITADGFPKAILSDGCSGSPSTDIGARLLCHITAKNLYLDWIDGTQFDPLPTLKQAKDASYDVFFQMEEYCLDATLLVGYRVGENIITNIWGDGVIAGKRKDGSILFYVFDQEDNAPKYLSYNLNSERQRLYREQFPGNVSLRVFPEEDHGLEIISWGKYGLRAEWPIEEFESVFLFSDGIRTFHTSDGEPADLSYIISSFINTKSYTGAFLKRRAQKFLRLCQKEGMTWIDDVSAAGIYTGK